MPPTTERQVAPYGTWESAISAASLVAGTKQVSEVKADPVDGDLIWWSETRPDGSTKVMRHSLKHGKTVEHTPADANIRSLVHEYGGGAWWPHNGELFCVDFKDQRLRVIDRDGRIRFLSGNATQSHTERFADGRVSSDGKWVVVVRETHQTDGTSETSAEIVEPRNEIVALPTNGTGMACVLYGGADFVSSPRLSADGKFLAWISWNHPNMGWDSTRLHFAHFDDGRLAGEICTIGAEDSASYCEPDFSDNQLRVCCDLQGWWNLYDVDLANGSLKQVVGGPFDIATPPWIFGMQRWTTATNADGEDVLIAVAGLPSGDKLLIDNKTVATTDSAITSLSTGPCATVAIGASFSHQAQVVRLKVDKSTVEREVIHATQPLAFDTGYLVEPEWITFPTFPVSDATGDATGDAIGDATGEAASEDQAHGLFYRPTNPKYVGATSELPPLMVLVHGGPTAQARRELQTAILYWTSRGIAVVDVDYRGSTGYGSEFRKSLNGQWGIADVSDCVAAAKYLAQRSDVDPDRCIIRGGSAGGFTVLAALANHDTFAVGASRYGIADLESLVTDTHKFESRYLDTLIGTYPQHRERYRQRSPINHIDSINVPLIVLQGGQDVIVPPSQSEMIVAALKTKGIPVEYLLFEEEQHGFRQAKNIVRALEAELAFFGRVLGFKPAGLSAAEPS